MVQKNATSPSTIKLLDTGAVKISFSHYSLTTEKRVLLPAASSAPDRLV